MKQEVVLRGFVSSSSMSDDGHAREPDGSNGNDADLAQSPRERPALGKMGELLHERTHTYQALAIRDGDRLIDAAQYLKSLPSAVDCPGADQIKVQLTISTDPLPLQSERCWWLVLIINELLMNALHQACLGGREGRIAIELMSEASVAHCTVSDDGAEVAGATPVNKLSSAHDLARSLGGRIGHWFDDKGTSLVVSFPLTKRELEADSGLS